MIKNDLDIAMCGINRVKGDDGIGKRFNSGFNNDFVSEDITSILLSSSFAAWNKMYRKDIWGNSRFPIGMTYEDFATIPKVMFGAKRIGYSNKVLYHYFYNSDSIILKRKKLRKADRNILKAQQILESSELFEDTILENFYIRRVLTSMAWNLFEYNEDDALEVVKKLVLDGKNKYPKIENNSIIAKLNFRQQVFVKNVLKENYRLAKVIVELNKVLNNIYRSMKLVFN